MSILVLLSRRHHRWVPRFAASPSSRWWMRGVVGGSRCLPHGQDGVGLKHGAPSGLSCAAHPSARLISHPVPPSSAPRCLVCARLYFVARCLVCVVTVTRERSESGLAVVLTPRLCFGPWRCCCGTDRPRGGFGVLCFGRASRWVQTCIVRVPCIADTCTGISHHRIAGCVCERSAHRGGVHVP